MELYGNRIVLFAPLYVTNECANICEYCGFRADNKDLKRRTLKMDELKEEVEILQNLGHKRLLMVYGEHPKCDIDWIVKTVETVYSVKAGKSGDIRRLNVNAAPMSTENFRKLKNSGIGTYQCFQETYHKETYQKMHIKGKKKDYLYRLYAMHRAQEAGIDDIGMGVLFGLFDPKFDMLALLQHAQELERVFGVGPHTISFPRIEPASGSELSKNPPCTIDDQMFKKVVAVIRLSMPYTGMILTTRETPEYRKELLKLGVSQVSAGSRTYPGAYKDAMISKENEQQFEVGDTRSMEVIIKELIQDMKYIPSFCTACYRLGRTGEHFMELVKPGFIHQFCEPNAILTLFEYLTDYATPEIREMGEKLIKQELASLKDNTIRKQTIERLEAIKTGKRDQFF